jgi:dienelactone hydrolase
LFFYTAGLAQYLSEGHKIPAIVVVPQSPQNQAWHPLYVNAIMEDASKLYRFDPTRIYLTGLSMGGMGSWSMALAYPHRFAALAPIAASFLNDSAADSLGNDLAPADQLLPILQRIKHLPTWVFHGDRDSLVPTELGQRSEALLKQAGGNTKITIYPMTDHDSWSQTYFDNPDFYPWLFAQTNLNTVWNETRPDIDTNRYVGVYTDANGAIAAEVKVMSDGRLSLTTRNDNQESQLIALDEHHFIGTGFAFFEGDDQHMKTLVLPGISTWTFQP